MEITPEALKEFKEIYEKEFKETITEAEALEMAQRVLNFFSIILKPLPEECHEAQKNIPDNQRQEKQSFDNPK
jgi:hypothetical protein